MPITINGNGTVTGVSVGGLPDGIVDTDMIAANAVTAAKRGAGAILQVVTTTDTSDYSTTGNTYVQGPETASLTLANSSNKVLVIANWMVFMDTRSGQTTSVSNALFRGDISSGTQITTGGQPMHYFGNTFNYEYYGGHAALLWLDTPGGNTTYSLAVRNQSDNGVAAKIRGSQQTSTITLMEIAV